MILFLLKCEPIKERLHLFYLLPYLLVSRIESDIFHTYLTNEVRGCGLVKKNVSIPLLVASKLFEKRKRRGNLRVETHCDNSVENGRRS